MKIPLRFFRPFKDEWPKIATDLNRTAMLRGPLDKRPTKHDGLYLVTDAAPMPELQYFDGTNWRRVSDNLVVM